MTMDDAARRWKETWERSWPTGDVDAIAALYAPNATYRALAFREPDRGIAGVRRYLEANVAAETDVECRFGVPLVDGDRAAVEWWGSWIEDGEPLTLAGVTILRFGADGLVVDHRDYWNEVQRREPPYGDWLNRGLAERG